MADLSVTAASVIASANAVKITQYNYGATVTAGQVVYKDSNNKWKLVDQDAAVTGNEANSVIGIALVGGANNQPGVVCVKDIYFTPGATLTNGTAVYASDNAGAITHDVPGSGSYTVFLGQPRSTSILNLNPTAGGVAV